MSQIVLNKISLKKLPEGFRYKWLEDHYLKTTYFLK